MVGVQPAGDGLLPVKHTICVGLGGTGREVLVRIRQNLVEAYGDLSQLPIISFVQIDTDSDGPIPSYRGKRIEFAPAEYVHIRVPLNTVNEFKHNHERRQNNNFIGTPDDHILEWFPDRLIRNLSTIENGAGALRPVGRFALFKNYHRVSQALSQAYGRVANADIAALIDRDINVRPGLRVFVAGSLCGGTGSGIFLDVGYILRRLFAATVAGFETHAYFVISAELYGNNDVVKGNCYAALKELDYYTREGTIFNAQYPGEHRLSESRPPYDFIYLISNATPGGAFVIPSIDPNAKGKITNIIAQKICLFVTSNAAAHAAVSARDNLLAIDAIEPHDHHPRPNRQRYITAGLASIYFPQDKINLVAANQIKIQVLQFWESGLGQTPSNTQIQKLYTSQFDWGTDDLGQLLQQRLEKVAVNGSPLSGNLERWRNEQYGQISAAQTRAEQDSLKVQLPQNAAALLNFVRPADSSKERGVWLTPIVEQTSDITNDIKASIEQFLEHILQPDHQFFGLDHALSWLQYLKTNLEQVRGQYAAQRPKEAEAELRNINSRMQNEVQAIQGRFLPFGKKQQIQKAFRAAVDQVVTLARQNYQWQISRQVQAAVEHLITFTGEKINSLNRLRGDINESIALLQTRGEKLAEVNIQERIGLPIMSRQDTEEAINAVLPSKEQERRLALNQLSIEVIQDAATVSSDRPPSLYGFLKPQFAPTQITSALDQVVDKRIASVMVTLRGSAIQRFMDMGSQQQLIAYLQTLQQQSDILLPLNLGDGHFNSANYKYTRLIAYHQPAGQDPHVQSFTQLLQQTGLLANAKWVQLPASEQHQVIFMTEYAGFPLRLVNDLKEKNYQFAYENRGQAGNFDYLHTNKTITLTDILPPPPEVVQEIQELFFKCLGLGIFQLEGDDLIWRNEKTGQPIVFGNDWSAVIDQLSWVQIYNPDQRNRTLVDSLREELSKRIQFLISNPREADGYFYRIRVLINEIRQYPQHHINYAMVPIVAGTEIGGLTQVARKGILQELIEEIERRLEGRNDLEHTVQPLQSINVKNQLPAQSPNVDTANDAEDNWD